MKSNTPKYSCETNKRRHTYI